MNNSIWNPSAHDTPHNNALDTLLADSVKHAMQARPKVVSPAAVTEDKSHGEEVAPMQDEEDHEQSMEEDLYSQMLRMREEAARHEAENMRLRKQLESQRELMSTMQEAMLMEAKGTDRDMTSFPSPQQPVMQPALPAASPPLHTDMPYPSFVHPAPFTSPSPAAAPSPELKPLHQTPQPVQSSPSISRSDTASKEEGWTCKVCTYQHTQQQALFLRCYCCNALK